MSSDPPENTKRLSDRLLERLSKPSRQEEKDGREQEQIRAIAEEIGQRQFSTIARVMTEGPRGGAPQSRGAAVIHRILEQVEDQPGGTVHDLAEQLGEKSIFVLSHVDDLVREGLLVRLEDGRLFRSRDYGPAETANQPEIQSQLSPENSTQAAQRLEWLRIYLQIYQFLARKLGVEPQCGRRMTLALNGGKFFEMKWGPNGVSITLYGIYPGRLADQFRREARFGNCRTNYSRLTGIIDIQGLCFADLDSVLPWIAAFYKDGQPK